MTFVPENMLGPRDKQAIGINKSNFQNSIESPSKVFKFYEDKTEKPKVSLLQASSLFSANLKGDADEDDIDLSLSPVRSVAQLSKGILQQKQDLPLLSPSPSKKKNYNTNLFS